MGDLKMKYAEDFRSIAREALRGKWLASVLTCFVASLIGAQIASESGGNGSSRSNREVGNIELSEYFSIEFLNPFVFCFQP